MDSDTRDDDDETALQGWASSLLAAQPGGGVPTLATKRAPNLKGEDAVRAKLLVEIADEKERMIDAGEVDLPIDRPVTRADCAPWIRPVDGSQNHERPCPYVSCRHHLALHVSTQTGAIEPLVPGVEVWEMAETCSLDFAERGGEPGSGVGHEHKLGELGEIFGVTRERIRQLELKANAKIKAGRKGRSILIEHAREHGLLDPPPKTKRHLPIVEDSDDEDIAEDTSHAAE